MVYFTIAGRPDCKFFVHAAYVAQYLKSRLPNFYYEEIQLRGEDWMDFLRNLHHEHPTWRQFKSPIIWRTVSFRGGKKYLLGTLSDFWEYCYDYYHLESIISKDDLHSLCLDNVELFDANIRKNSEERDNKLHILITGAGNNVTRTLIPELLKINNLCLGKTGLIIFLYEEEPIHKHFLEKVVWNSHTYSNIQFIFEIIIVESITEALRFADLLIILNNFCKLPGNSMESTYAKSANKMSAFVDNINLYCLSKSMKVLFAGEGVIGFNANMLMKNTFIENTGIVTLSSDLGLGPLNFLSKLKDIKVENLSGPPVWGLVGTNHFVDLGSAVEMFDMHLPYKRAITNKGGSTLSQGLIHKELRFLRYITDDIVDFWERYETHRAEMEIALNRKPSLAKTRAIVDLLEHWFDDSPNIDRKVISLGIESNGTFGLPPNLIFSQPAILQNGIWVPYEKFPVSESTKTKINKIALESVNLLENYDLRLKKISSNSVIYEQ